MYAHRSLYGNSYGVFLVPTSPITIMLPLMSKRIYLTLFEFENVAHLITLYHIADTYKAFKDIAPSRGRRFAILLP